MSPEGLSLSFAPAFGSGHLEEAKSDWPAARGDRGSYVRALQVPHRTPYVGRHRWVTLRVYAAPLNWGGDSDTLIWGTVIFAIAILLNAGMYVGLGFVFWPIAKRPLNQPHKTS
jgi:hypothetical protein